MKNEVLMKLSCKLKFERHKYFHLIKQPLITLDLKYFIIETTLRYLKSILQSRSSLLPSFCRYMWLPSSGEPRSSELAHNGTPPFSSSLQPVLLFNFYVGSYKIFQPHLCVFTLNGFVGNGFNDGVNEQMYDWMSEEWMNKWVNEWSDEWVNEQRFRSKFLWRFCSCKRSLWRIACYSFFAFLPLPCYQRMLSDWVLYLFRFFSHRCTGLCAVIM